MYIDLNTFNLDSATIKIGFLLFFVGLFLALCLLFVFCFKIGKKVGKLEYKAEFSSEIEEARKDAIKKSKAVTNGQISEQLAPFLPKFPCSYENCRFIGKPVDFLCFENLEDENKSEVIFVEVKTGSSFLSKREKALKQAIKNKRVRYVEYRI